ncbi:hypothetical protein [Bacillus sp. FJAT-28004]|uniref:hypothetical protein n=1 Tax=Bacillus sp. FJAT-28004 TaxID=1679165 RepID=UPI0006B4CBD1|nr:hypothetical protein [Bacillus sp. FJAT-28004]
MQDKGVSQSAPAMIQFGIFADLHQDIMHDGEQRLQQFINRMNGEQIDFIVQLGYLFQPKSEKRQHDY